MPKSKRKFIEWVFKDEATNKEHQIQVYTLVENETVSFEAEVKHPERFTDRDENANVLKQRVLARCKEKRKLEWKPYILVTVSHEGFGRDALNFISCLRNYYGIGLLFEPFESAVLGDGTRIWRGISGKSYRFGPDAVPGWPTFGKTGRSVCRHFEDTPENRETAHSDSRACSHRWHAVWPAPPVQRTMMRCWMLSVCARSTRLPARIAHVRRSATRRVRSRPNQVQLRHLHHQLPVHPRLPDPRRPRAAVATRGRP